MLLPAFGMQLMALSAITILTLYSSYYYLNRDNFTSTKNGYSTLIPSLGDMLILKSKPSTIADYLARERIVVALNNDAPVSVHISTIGWFHMDPSPLLLIPNCPIRCEFSRNPNDDDFVSEEQQRQAATKDGILSLMFQNFPRNKPSVQVFGSGSHPKFQRWILFAMEPQFYYDFYANQTWLDQNRVDLFLNFHEDMAQVPVSYVEKPDLMVKDVYFNIQEFVQHNQNHPHQRRPFMSWFSSRHTDMRAIWGPGMAKVLGPEFHIFSTGQYKNISNGILPQPCLATGDDKLVARTCATAFYPFTLSIENCFETDYASEKLWQAFESGVVPVYAGPPNVRDFVPKGSTIFIEDFESPEKLAAYLKEVAADVRKYEKFHEWRKQPEREWPEGFKLKMKLSLKNMQCNLCVELARLRYLEKPEVIQAMDGMTQAVYAA
ncbi:hypothetical protein EDD21DRAFT_377616 [Dissophora ornata]|nr:hypothetical protein BGZ58_000226 [Dissophora ornata]KAI8600275.1 hypothetical protein EDD21DRAFT_377616 [Dissophora ornata]